jgi:putative ABC transport system ATP-binding protein
MPAPQVSVDVTSISHAGSSARAALSVSGTSEERPPAPISRIVELARLERRDVWVVVVYATFVGLLTLTVPLAGQALVSTVAFGTILQPLFVLALVLLVGTLFSALFQAVQTWVVEVIQWRILLRLSSDLAYRLPRLTRRVLDSSNAPTLVNRFFDVFTVQKTASWLLLDGLGIVLTASVGMLLLASYHPILLAFDIAIIVVAAVVLLGLGRGGEKSAIKESKAKHHLASWLEEIAGHRYVFRESPARAFAWGKTDLLTREYLHARQKHFKVIFRQIVGSLALQAIAQTALLSVGGYLVMKEQLTLGQLVAAELAVGAIVSSIAKIGRYLDNLYDMLAAVEKVGSLLDLPTESGDHGALTPIDGVPVLRVKSLSVPGAGISGLLTNLSLEVHRGDFISLVGGPGTGKTRLAECFIGMVTPAAGAIEVWGNDLRDVGLEDIRHHIRVVGRPEIIDGTLAENIALGRPDVPHSRVRDTLRELRVDTLFDWLPNGLDTSLLSGGVRISETQASAVALARALVNPPDLLVLDGALDHLAPSFRESLVADIRRLLGTGALMVMTQHPDLARLCGTTIQLDASLSGGSNHG